MRITDQIKETEKILSIFLAIISVVKRRFLAIVIILLRNKFPPAFEFCKGSTSHNSVSSVSMLFMKKPAHQQQQAVLVVRSSHRSWPPTHHTPVREQQKQHT